MLRENNVPYFHENAFGSQGGESPQKDETQNHLAMVKAQVEEVVGIMQVNVEKVLEREQHLACLDNRSEALQMGATQFEKQSKRVRRKAWWQHRKMMFYICVMTLIMIGLIVVIYRYSGEK
ncbi:Synaptobrevin [Gryllus bimaculatus]|nr:Synaptobrevin [Gryllus bimaculatus]